MLPKHYILRISLETAQNMVFTEIFQRISEGHIDRILVKFPMFLNKMQNTRVFEKFEKNIKSCQNH